MGIHDGHRERLREEARKTGVEDLSEIRALELLLTYAIPRVDTNPIAHALLDRFGSFSKVLDAEISELTQVEGVGESAALLLHSIPGYISRYESGKVDDSLRLNSSDAAARFLRPKFLPKSTESIALLCLDAKMCCKYFAFLGTGSVGSVEVPLREIVETAIRCRASCAILAHNHPAGTSEPSREDLDTTEKVKNALETVGIPLLDHIILLGGGGYVSLSELGLM